MRDRIVIFLDRDGTIIKYIPYLHNPNKVNLIKGAKKSIKFFLENKFYLFLFTNQSGVGRGFFKMEDVKKCNNKMTSLLGYKNINQIFKEICIATDNPKNLNSNSFINSKVYRKPSPLFIKETLYKYGLKKDKSYMVGDMNSDVESGLNAGINSVLLSSNKKRLKSLNCKNFDVQKDLITWTKKMFQIKY
jgi:D-glycero-D-manno-heptose 1,7-bisphosphate phosphatase